MPEADQGIEVSPLPEKGSDELMPVFIRELVAAAKLADQFNYCLEAGQKFHLSIDGPPGYMRLVVEVPMTRMVSVAHYFEQNGDLVRDPEMVFFTSRKAAGLALPKSVAASLKEQWFLKEVIIDTLPDPVDPKQSYYRRYKTGVPIHVESFPNTWANNLREQGFLQQVAEGKFESITHPRNLESDLEPPTRQTH